MADEPLFAIRYKGETSPFEWTFVEACKMMRAIPVTDSMQVIMPDGQVHFTLPKRKKEKDDKRDSEKTASK